MKPENVQKVGRVGTARRSKVSHFCRALFLVLFASTASDADCVQDTLAKIDGGVLLVTTSGSVYRVINSNGIDLAFWLPPAGIVVCDQINMSGEPYYAISNQDANETVFARRER